MAPPIWSHDEFDFNITLTASTTAQFSSVLANADTQDFGVRIHNLRASVKMAVKFATTPGSETTEMHVSGQTGFFKWPSAASVPTLTEIDPLSSGRVFNRKVITALGTFPGGTNLNWKRVNLKPGEELFLYVHFTRQSGATADMTGVIQGVFDFTRA